MASPFVGGPEQQVLGLAEALRPGCDTVFLTFAEDGRAQAFLDEARRRCFEAVKLTHNTPHFFRAACEIAGHLRRTRAAVLCCNGYKPDIIGWLAARRAGVPVVSISHGWTAASWKVRLNEALDRWVLSHFDQTACVAEAQARRVRRAGVDPSRVVVIRNAIDPTSHDNADPVTRRFLEGLFPCKPARIVAAAGRLSPEKGFDVYIDAAALVCRRDPAVGFVLFGDGPLRHALTRRIAANGLQQRFVMPGFRTEVRCFWPACDLAVLSSHREGLPVMVLEALPAGAPVVATPVGGTPEAIEDGLHGLLVPPGDAEALAERIAEALAAPLWRRAAGACGQQRVREHFNFAVQAKRYRRLFDELLSAQQVARHETGLRHEPETQANAEGTT
jgi:glycosyltransferase involved in cell wall biosynthesis